MSWNLTEEEQGLLMNAVRDVLAPWTGRVEATITFEGEPMTIYPVGIRREAPEEIRELNGVYEGIIDKGAFAVDPERIRSEETP